MQDPKRTCGGEGDEGLVDASDKRGALVATLPLEKYQNLLAYVARKTKENEVLRAGVLREREEKRLAEAKLATAQHAVDRKEVELRNYVEEVERLSFAKENLSKKVVQLQDQLTEMKAGADAATPTMLGSLLASATWESKELARLQGRLAVIAQELEMKIEENEALHMQLFNARQEGERHAAVTSREHGKLEARLHDVMALATAREVAFSALTARCDALTQRAAQMRQRLGAAQAQSQFASSQLGAVRSQLQAHIQSLCTRLVEMAPLDVGRISAYRDCDLRGDDCTALLQAARAAGGSHAFHSSTSRLLALGYSFASSLSSWHAAVSGRVMARLRVPVLSSDALGGHERAVGAGRRHRCDEMLQSALLSLQLAVNRWLSVSSVCSALLSGSGVMSPVGEASSFQHASERRVFTGAEALFCEMDDEDAAPLAAKFDGNYASNQLSSAVVVPSWVAAAVSRAYGPLLCAAALSHLCGAIARVQRARLECLRATESGILECRRVAEGGGFGVSLAACEQLGHHALVAPGNSRADELRVLAEAAAAGCDQLAACQEAWASAGEAVKISWLHHAAVAAALPHAARQSAASQHGSEEIRLPQEVWDAAVLVFDCIDATEESSENIALSVFCSDFLPELEPFAALPERMDALVCSRLLRLPRERPLRLHALYPGLFPGCRLAAATAMQGEGAGKVSEPAAADEPPPPRGAEARPWAVDLNTAVLLRIAADCWLVSHKRVAVVQAATSSLCADEWASLFPRQPRPASPSSGKHTVLGFRDSSASHALAMKALQAGYTGDDGDGCGEFDEAFEERSPAVSLEESLVALTAADSAVYQAEGVAIAGAFHGVWREAVTWLQLLHAHAESERPDGCVSAALFYVPAAGSLLSPEALLPAELLQPECPSVTAADDADVNSSVEAQQAGAESAPLDTADWVRLLMAGPLKPEPSDATDEQLVEEDGGGGTFVTPPPSAAKHHERGYGPVSHPFPAAPQSGSAATAGAVCEVRSIRASESQALSATHLRESYAATHCSPAAPPFFSPLLPAAIGNSSSKLLADAAAPVASAMGGALAATAARENASTLSHSECVAWLLDRPLSTLVSPLGAVAAAAVRSQPARTVPAEGEGASEGTYLAAAATFDPAALRGVLHARAAAFARRLQAESGSSIGGCRAMPPKYTHAAAAAAVARYAGERARREAAELRCGSLQALGALQQGSLDAARGEAAAAAAALAAARDESALAAASAAAALEGASRAGERHRQISAMRAAEVQELQGALASRDAAAAAQALALQAAVDARAGALERAADEAARAREAAALAAGRERELVAALATAAADRDALAVQLAAATAEAAAAAAAAAAQRLQRLASESTQREALVAAEAQRAAASAEALAAAEAQLRGLRAAQLADLRELQAAAASAALSPARVLPESATTKEVPVTQATANEDDATVRTSMCEAEEAASSAVEQDYAIAAAAADDPPCPMPPPPPQGVHALGTRMLTPPRTPSDAPLASSSPPGTPSRGQQQSQDEPTLLAAASSPAAAVEATADESAAPPPPPSVACVDDDARSYADHQCGGTDAVFDDMSASAAMLDPNTSHVGDHGGNAAAAALRTTSFGSPSASRLVLDAPFTPFALLAANVATAVGGGDEAGPGPVDSWRRGRRARDAAAATAAGWSDADEAAPTDAPAAESLAAAGAVTSDGGGMRAAAAQAAGGALSLAQGFFSSLLLGGGRPAATASVHFGPPEGGDAAYYSPAGGEGEGEGAASRAPAQHGGAVFDVGADGDADAPDVDAGTGSLTRRQPPAAGASISGGVVAASAGRAASVHAASRLAPEAASGLGGGKRSQQQQQQEAESEARALRVQLEEERGRSHRLWLRVAELEEAATGRQPPSAAAAAAAAVAAGHEAELSELQRAHEELVAAVSDSYQAQLRALSEHAAVSDNDLRRAEGELRALGARRVRCAMAECGAWTGVAEAVLARGRCGACTRLIEHFQ